MTRRERFMSKVDVHTGTGCWIWTGGRGGSGYGSFWDGTRHIQAHWFLLEAHPGAGYEACHRCDNKLCVRPSHIFIGTRSDNVRDCVKKGRHNPMPGYRAMLLVRDYSGTKNHQSKLTDDQVAEIKAAPRAFGIQVALARKFNVSQSCISRIRLGQTWKATKGQP